MVTARRALTAAAARYTARKTKRSSADSTTNAGWQQRAWQFYDTTPEVRFAAQWISAAMGSATLYAGRRADDGVTIEPAPDNHPASEIVAAIAGGPEGQAQLLGAFGPHLVVPGEGWIVVRPREDSDGQDWHVLSVEEMQRQGQKLIAEVDGDPVEIPPADPDGPPDDSSPVAIRVWQPHPRRYLDSDSPVRAALGLLEELRLLNAAIAAIARSRLTGRGVLLVPQGTRFPTAKAQDAEDDLIEVFMEVAETAYREPESAAATVPILLEVPADTIASIKRLTFESDFDQLAIQLREECIRRFATGMDVPAEVLLGSTGLNHWGVWAMKEEAITLGVEPRLETVTHALTTQWLRPLLSDDPEEAARCVVVADTSGLRVRANRSATALEVYKVGAISASALRRETGFDESDAPTDEETAQPDQQQEPDSERPGQEDTEEKDIPVGESDAEPDTLPASARAAAPLPPAVLEAADALVWQALTSAGQKLRRTPACPRSARALAREIEPANLHTSLRVEESQVDQWRLLEGAWSRLPEVAARLGLDPECLRDALDTYCRELIAAGIAHSFDLTPAALRASCLVTAA